MGYEARANGSAAYAAECGYKDVRFKAPKEPLPIGAPSLSFTLRPTINTIRAFIQRKYGRRSR